MSIKAILILIVCLAGILLLSVLAAVLIAKLVKKKKQGDGKKDLLFKRVAAAREIVAPDGIDPSMIFMSGALPLTCSRNVLCSR